MKLKIFNVRGIRKRLSAAHEISKDTALLAVCETWIKNAEDPVVEALDVRVQAPLTSVGRGHGGVGLIVNPLITFEVMTKIARPEIQAVTVKMGSVVVTSIYVAPRAKKEEEIQVMDMINRISGDKAVIMGDMNSRHTEWNTATNPRGKRLKSWASKHGWHVKAANEPTYVTKAKTSNLDIFVIKGLNTERLYISREDRHGGSDHLPVTVEIIDTTTIEQRKRGHIPRRQRANKEIINTAEQKYEQMLPECLRQARDARNVRELEKAYDDFKRVLLEPWEHTRYRKPKRFKDFWNNRLDQMAKQRRRLYRKDLLSGSQAAKTK